MRLNELASDFGASQRIFVTDEGDVLPVDQRQNLDPKLEFGWDEEGEGFLEELCKDAPRREDEKILERTKDAALLAFLDPKLDDHFWTERSRAFVPLKIYKVYTDEEKLNEELKSIKNPDTPLMNYLKKFSKPV